MDYTINKKWNAPRCYVACPACDRVYGHHKTKICMLCEECSKCCFCEKKDLKPADEAVPRLLEKS